MFIKTHQISNSFAKLRALQKKRASHFTVFKFYLNKKNKKSLKIKIKVK